MGTTNGSFRYGLLFTSVVTVCAALLGINVCSLIPSPTNAAQADGSTPLIMLQSDRLLGGSRPVSHIFTSTWDRQTVYMVDGFSGDVEAYNEASAASSRIFNHTSGPIVLGRDGRTVYEDKDSMVVVVDSAGKQLAKFSTFPLVSLAVLSNGNIVIASPVGTGFLHIYNSEGRLLRSFGRIRDYSVPAVDNNENQFLRRGTVLVDAADNIYYVFQYVPLIQKYSPAGKLVFEREVGGKAIDIQQDVARRFFSSKASGSIGGIHIINSAAIDHKKNHLWICMNGSTSAGVVYEYSSQGEKLWEYGLVVVSPLALEQRVTGVKGIAVTRSNLYALTNDHQVISFEIHHSSTWKSGNNDFRPTVACGTDQPWGDCGFVCPGVTCSGTTPTTTSSDGTTQDCKASLLATLQPGYVVIKPNCQTYTPGTAMHLRGGCTASVTVCYPDLGNSDHSATLDCPAPPSGSCPSGDLGGGFCDALPPVGGCGTCWDWDDVRCMCVYVGCSPILVDILGNGFDLTDASSGVNFDLHGDGSTQRLAWTAVGSDDAFLALDRNGNGMIDNGTELFGNFTPQPAVIHRNGFLALAEFDKPANGGNGDGMIDSHDEIFSKLRLWQDTNHNGISELGELHRLPELGVHSISLDYKESKRTDRFGNQFRYRAKVYDVRGEHLGRWAWDVFFVSQ